MNEDVLRLTGSVDTDGRPLNSPLEGVGFADCELAAQRLNGLCVDDHSREALANCLPMLLTGLSETADPDKSLVNFDRYARSLADRTEAFQFLARKPRSIEILIKLFVGSQFLTEILIRNPRYLHELTNHKQLAEFKSRPQFIAEAARQLAGFDSLPAKLDALRRFQQWELLRIGACDSFGLFDLKSVTVQLSLLADGIVQSCLNLVSDDLGVSADGFAVIAFGKLGGEELNYSSDIDLAFLADDNAERFWRLGQKLIKALADATGEGFLYRVDMRLRPWGAAGALVNTVSGHATYIEEHGEAWEKQALLKARVIAGDQTVGKSFLRQVEPLLFATPPGEVRASVRKMKSKIEASLKKTNRERGDVKAGQGSIRDIEFTTQCLQLIHGGECRDVRSFNTIDGLVRLADFGFLHADEYRQLTSGYGFLRTIEHTLQLMHDKQVHTLPTSQRELEYLAQRLDFSNGEHFLKYYKQHCKAVRAVYAKYVENREGKQRGNTRLPIAERMADHRERMAPSYRETFEESEIARHADMLERLSAEVLIEIEAVSDDVGGWRLSIVGDHHPGELSLICGLLFVYGFNIQSGHVFTAEAPAKPTPRGEPTRRHFISELSLSPSTETLAADVWLQYRDELTELVEVLRDNRQPEAQGRLVTRVAAAFPTESGDVPTISGVEIEIDHTTAEHATLLHIRSEDTIGFLYELTNALAMAGVIIERVSISSVGSQVFDTLFVTDAHGKKIEEETRINELRATIVLTKHFTHLLPRAPNPQAALIQFREFLHQLFQRPDWTAELSSLERPAVLRGLAKLLGVSNFLWEDFLRSQHENLFPVLADIEALSRDKPKEQLQSELAALIADADDDTQRRDRLNAFKDREMFRIDMRHILGHTTEFGRFAEELSDLADTVVRAAFDVCCEILTQRFGQPCDKETQPCPINVCALGKFGGRELGFASDVELMFVYGDDGQTDGSESITTQDYVSRLVDLFRKTIRTRQKGIFEIDLRLRPYGSAGSTAVSLRAFHDYFTQDGAAWPYERQALVKLRPVAGDRKLGQRIVARRDEIVFARGAFDVTAMRALREKQLRQLVAAGTFHAKLSPGGLVDCEYLVQGLQMRYGSEFPSLRTRSTRKAIVALCDAGVFSAVDRDRLLEAYIFFRRLIDALRMVRGNARDLTVPDYDSEEFLFLSRRLTYGGRVDHLSDDIQRHSERILSFAGLLDSSMANESGGE